MDESKTPPTHLGSCRYLTLHRGGFGFVHHSIAILYHPVPNPSLTIRDFCVAVLQVSEAGRAALLDVAPSKRALALGRQDQKSQFSTTK